MMWYLPYILMVVLLLVVIGKNVLQQVVMQEFEQTKEQQLKEEEEVMKNLRLYSKVWNDEEIEHLHKILDNHRTIK